MRFYAPAVRFNQVLHDGEAESGAALFARAAGIGAVEAFEDAGQVLRGNPGAGVGDGDGYATGRGFERDGDTAAWWRVSQGVVEQVGEHLP